MNFGSRLKTLRTEMRLTQAQLAERIGVVKSVISFYESGDRYPSLDTLVKIASVFHVTTDFLLGIERTVLLNVSDLSESEIGALQITADAFRSNHVTGKKYHKK